MLLFGKVLACLFVCLFCVSLFMCCVKTAHASVQQIQHNFEDVLFQLHNVETVVSLENTDLCRTASNIHVSLGCASGWIGLHCMVLMLFGAIHPSAVSPMSQRMLGL